MPEVCDCIEASKKPVITSMSGATLGGGLEIALAAHFRVATPSATFGFPEVTLGLIPGAGGTQRAPRLIGIKSSLAMMLTGKSINAHEALSIGLIDHLNQSEDALSNGLRFIQTLVKGEINIRRRADVKISSKDLEKATLALDEARQGSKAIGTSFGATQALIEALEGSITLPRHEGMARERALFLQCLGSPERSALVHVFQSERKVMKLPSEFHGSARPINSAGVVGGGTMGASIAVCLLNGGLSVVLIEQDNDRLETGLERIRSILQHLHSRGRMSKQEHEAVLQRLQGATDYIALSTVDLVIEAVFEDIVVKKAVFERLAEVCNPKSILATNTSYLDINEISSGLSRRSDVLGLHFFSPAHIMRLMEIVVPQSTSKDVVASGFELARRLGKIAVRSAVSDGFIGNRILANYRKAAEYMMEDGASPYQIDSAVRAFGFPMGPFQISDLSGGDIGWAQRKRKAATRDYRERYVPIADRLCEAGWFGQKTGRGYYRYTDGKRIGEPDEDVLLLIENVRREKGIKPRSFTDEEIIRRYLAAMINEAANVVDQGVAERPLDIDITMIHGYAFPRYRGGPMKYADDYGLDKLLADIREFALEDAYFWQPSNLLQERVTTSGLFEDLNN